MFTFPVSRDRREEDLSLKGNFKGWQGLGRVSNWWGKSGKLLKGLFLHHFHLFLVPERRYRTELSPDGQWRDSQRMWVTEGNVMFTSRSLSLRSFSTIKIPSIYNKWPSPGCYEGWRERTGSRCKMDKVGGKDIPPSWVSLGDKTSPNHTHGTQFPSGTLILCSYRTGLTLNIDDDGNRPFRDQYMTDNLWQGSYIHLTCGQEMAK